MTSANQSTSANPASTLVMGWLDRMVRRCHIHRWTDIIGSRPDRTDWACWLRSCRCGKVQYRSLREPIALSKWYDLDDDSGPANQWELPELRKSAQHHGLLAPNIVVAMSTSSGLPPPTSPSSPSSKKAPQIPQ